MVRRVLVLGLALVLAASATEAKSRKKTKIAPHPSKLEYPKLDFDVPDAAKYRHVLSNGVVVYVAEDHDLPLVDVSVTVRVGEFLDPQDKPGLASMTGTMLRQGGAGELSAEEFDERIDFLAADLRSYTASTQGGASLNCISPVLDESLDLMFQMMRAPRFQQDRLDVEKDDLLEEMKQRNDEPRSISGREWNWLMRGQDHFTARELTAAQVRAVNRDDLSSFHRKYWRPDNMILAVSGDVTTEQLLQKLEQRFAGWNTEGPEVAWPPPAPRHNPEPGVYRVEKDIPQGRVLIGQLGLQRKDWNDPDAYALVVMNDILGGGGFTSRLVKRIRSDEGLAYSAFSQYRVGQYWPGVFRMGYQSKSETVALAAAIALEEVGRIRSEEVSAQELVTAKASFVDVFPRRFESAEDIVSVFADDAYEGRPHDYWKTYRERVSAVTTKDVLRVAKKYLDPDKLVYLIVGKWSDIEPGDADNRAAMKQFAGGRSTELPLRDPMTLEPM